MSVGASITVTVTRDEATPYIDRLIHAMRSIDGRKVIARGLEGDVRDHLIDYNRRNPNKHVSAGWQRTNIVRDAANATHGEATDHGVRISINHPMIALRYFGGTITPVKAKLLAIPIDPNHPAADPEAAEAYGKSPKSFHHLRLIMFGKTGKGALVGRKRTNLTFGADRRKGRKGQTRTKKGNTIHGGIYYWLVQRATVKADKTILPTNQTIQQQAAEHAADYIDIATEDTP